MLHAARWYGAGIFSKVVNRAKVDSIVRLKDTSAVPVEQEKKKQENQSAHALY